ncbi:hypothetical protein LTR36_004462 [Oleoguttula mirabilis]|uniref:Xylanolytic transcriptional activator regulatory domain-containing protein n=1 Tax=Oleoguttula mirabilis TaxID=1507867 RepID=A0AAV9JHD6_9PEZI|nr:hypothetical protein LTR36_004462 [Oleoguttula mirabilis]
MAPRGVASDASSLAGHASSAIHSAGSAAESKATSIESAVQSEATSIQSAAISKANSALAAVETGLVKVVDKVFNGIISELNLTDFYAIHISTTCQGVYKFKNGTDITPGNSSLPGKGTHEHVDSCSAHSALDPMSLVRILYWIAIVFTGAAFLLGIAGIVLTSRKVALWNIIGTAPAFCLFLLASAVTHGIALGAAKLINFVGGDVGIAGYAGHKFLTLTWSVTALLLVNMLLWTLLKVASAHEQHAGPCEYPTTKRTSIVPNGDLPQPPPEPALVELTPPSIIKLQKHPLTAPGARFHHRSILDPVKVRFVRANSAIAFPRILGMDLESESIPRLHSFAWHTGIRAEPAEKTFDLSTLLTWTDVQRLAKVYFKLVNTEFGLLDELDFTEQAATRFTSPAGQSDVDTVVLGVAAIGSFFSPDPHARETEFIFGAADILMQKSITHSPTANNVAAWILRTIYLRLCSRPHGSFLCSSITMHQAEASGLHKEMQTIAVVYPAPPTGDHKLGKTRRRLFWIARALNIILSFEYGRSRVNFDVVTTNKFSPERGSHAHQFVELADILPNDYVDREREPDPPAALGNALTKIEELQSDSAFINLLKADLAFAIYRRLWLMSLTDAKDRAESVISIGKAALAASAALLETRTPWWNVVHAPFQFLCVVLAVGTPKSLSHIQEVMALLHKIALTYDTHMCREAYNQAAALVKMSRKRKEKELDALYSGPEAALFDDPPSVGSSMGMTEAPNLDWAMDLPFDFDIFLNPSLIVSSQQGHGAAETQFNGHLGF